MSACVPCVPLLVHVDMGVQTDDGGADRDMGVQNTSETFCWSSSACAYRQRWTCSSVVWPRHYCFAGSC
jgi:hypothetical protein